MYLRRANERTRKQRREKMNQQELKNVLDLHRKWVLSESDGVRADLRYANLRYANLRSADLRSADLSYANLSSANLSSADLRYADLRYANLSYANLSYADLEPIKQDFFKVLDAAKPEVISLYDSIMRGKIDGTKYEGECACLKGTIANIKKCNYRDLKNGLKPDADSISERWFLAILEGDTPQSNQVAKITEEWMLEWALINEMPLPEYKLVSSVGAPQLFGVSK